MIGHPCYRMATLAVVLALAGAVSLVSTISAEEASSDVTVTATIESLPISLTLCDTTANFGTGLDAIGSAATSVDQVDSVVGDPALNQGAYYQWTPSCGVGEAFITVVSGNPWLGNVCATLGSNTSSLDLTDLRYSPTDWVSLSSTYDQITSGSHAFSSCPTLTSWLDTFLTPGSTGAPGTNLFDAWYYLKIDRDDLGGQVNATSTWSVTG